MLCTSSPTYYSFTYTCSSSHYLFHRQSDCHLSTILILATLCALCLPESLRSGLASFSDVCVSYTTGPPWPHHMGDHLLDLQYNPSIVPSFVILSFCYCVRRVVGFPRIAELWDLMLFPGLLSHQSSPSNLCDTQSSSKTPSSSPISSPNLRTTPFRALQAGLSGKESKKLSP